MPMVLTRFMQARTSMMRRPRCRTHGFVYLALALTLCASSAPAFPSFGTTVNDYCTDNERSNSMPFAGDCALCHDGLDAGRGRTPLFDAFKRNDLDAFCPMSMNAPPAFDPIPAQMAREDALLTIEVFAGDPEGGRVTLVAADLPTGATFQDLGAGGGQFLWTPSYEQAGNHPVRFIATDDAIPAESASATVMITVGDVNRGPLLDRIADQSVEAGQGLEVELRAGDPDGDAVEFGHAGLPGTAVLVDRGDGSALFSWTPSIEDTGSVSVTIAVTDSGSPMASASQQFTIAVGATNLPPVLQPIGDRSAAEGDFVEIQLSATDSNGDALLFACDGAPVNFTLAPESEGTVRLVGLVASGSSGNYAIRCSVQDSAVPPAVDAEDFTLTVGSVNRPPVLDPIHMSMDGDVVVVRVTARDPDGDTVTFDATGVPPTAEFTELGSGAAELRWLPSFGTTGDFPLEFAVTDFGATPHRVSQTFTIRLDLPVSTPLALERASWNPRRGVLRVRGTGTAGGEILEIVDLPSAVVLGTATTDATGRFHVRLLVDLELGPCAVLARSETGASEPIALRRSGWHCSGGRARAVGGRRKPR